MEDRLADAEHRRQQQDDDGGADQSAPGQHGADGADDLNVRGNADAQGRRKEHESAGEDGGIRGRGGGDGRLLPVLAGAQLLLEAGGHEDGVVHRGAQLDAADDGGGDEGDHRAGEVGDALVDEDGQLNGRHQHHGYAEGLENDGDDQEDGGDGDVVGGLEVHRRGLDEVVGQGRLAGDDAACIVGFHDGLELRELVCHLVGGGGILRVHHHHLPAAGLQHAADLVRHKEIRDAAAEDAVVGDEGRDPVHRLDLPLHGAELLGAEVVPHQDEVGGRHVILVLQLLVGNDGGHVPGQGLVQLVVDLRHVLRHGEGQEEQEEDGDIDAPLLHDVPVELFHGGDELTVPVLRDLAVEKEEHGGQHEDDGKHPQHHALGHDDADVPSQGQAHEAEGHEARHRREAGAGEGGEGRLHRRRHGVPLILVVGALLHVAAVEEDGVVHGDAQLQHRRDGLRNVRDLP